MKKAVYRALMDLDPFVGLDGVTYEIRNGEKVTLPEAQGEVIVGKGALERMEVPIPVEMEQGFVFFPASIEDADRDQLYEALTRLEKLGARSPKGIEVFDDNELREAVLKMNCDPVAVREYNKPEIKENLPEPYHLTDLGNSERFVDQHGDDIRFCVPLSAWYVWNGKIWENDLTAQIHEKAAVTVKQLYVEASRSDDSQSVAKWALNSEAIQRRDAMVKGCIHLVAIKPEEFDKEPDLLNCLNGTLNLQDFSFKAHSREDMLTKIGGIAYSATEECPLWQKHLELIFSDKDGNPDHDTITAFQEVLGYSLLQNNPDQVVFFLWGNGKNGKSETVKVISRILNDYCVNLPANSIMESRRGGGDIPRSDLLMLKGARVATISEPGQGDILSESLIKGVTGDHVITARPNHGKYPIQFRPGAKIFLSTNHKPKISGLDEGIWRRIWLFPFVREIPKDVRMSDYGDILFEKEGPGILNWMLHGLKMYQKRGRLEQPKSVEGATKGYRIDSNPLGRFISEKCLVDAGQECKRSELYYDYSTWCALISWKPLSRQIVNQVLSTLFEERRDQGGRYWIGIRPLTEKELSEKEKSGDIQKEVI